MSRRPVAAALIAAAAVLASGCAGRRDAVPPAAALPPAWLAVVVVVRGAPDADYRLQVDHEAGVSVTQPGRADRRHLLHLPPGPCVVVVEWPKVPARRGEVVVRLLPGGEEVVVEVRGS